MRTLSAPEVRALFCPNCGTQNPETAATCTKCGFALKGGAPGGAAAPKFKGTMLMQGAPPAMQAAREAAAAQQAAGGAGPMSAATGAAAPPSRLKGTIVGVAAPAAGAAPAPPGPGGDLGAGFGAPPPQDQHQFGGGGANPLGATFALGQDSPGPFGGDPNAGVGAPPPAAGAPYGGGAPGADAGAGAGFPGTVAFQAPPAAGAAPDANQFGGAPQGGYGGAPPGGDPNMGGYGGQPMGGAPMGGPPADGGFGAQAQYGAPPGGGAPQGYQQPGGGFGGDPMQQQMNQGMNPYGGGAPMMGPMGANPMAAMGGPGQKSWMTTLLLAIFVGWAGVHRFYTGHTLLGVLQLITCGGGGIWQLVDIIFILMGKYTDAQGRPLQR